MIDILHLDEFTHQNRYKWSGLLQLQYIARVKDCTLE